MYNTNNGLIMNNFYEYSVYLSNTTNWKRRTRAVTFYLQFSKTKTAPYNSMFGVVTLKESEYYMVICEFFLIIVIVKS